jgi:hypothetical protein
MVLFETQGHMAISGRAPGHIVGPGPRPLNPGQLLILMLARDLETLGTKLPAAAVVEDWPRIAQLRAL